MGGAEIPLLKRILILAVFVFGACCVTGIRASATPAGKPQSKSKPTAKKKATTTARKRVVRRRRRWSPWHVSSYADSAEDDDTQGEDPAARAAALEALGRWNGSVTVVDPNTGRILAIVNQKLALESAFTPCSTFKPVVAVGALKEGLITSDTKLWVARRKKMDLEEALAHSNNRFFDKLGEMLGFARVSEYAHKFGLGEKAGWNIPGESPGKFPDQPPKEGVGILSAYGQGIEVTPLQLAAIISAFANGGTMYYLQYPRTQQELEAFQPVVHRHLEGLSEFFPEVKQGLAGAVIYGTARLAFNPEEQIFGKTGTCSEDGARLGWFVSYSNAEQPKYVVTVLLRGGRMMYGPHAAEIAGKVYRGLRERTQIAARQEETSSEGAGNR
jgi:penicillin-binding protein 2